MRSHLPLLASIEIASPCPMSWAKMDGSNTQRYCDSCQLHVHDLSAMTSQEAETLLQNHEGELCVRYAQDSKGRVLTDEFPTPLRPLRSLVLKYCATAAACLVLLLTTGIHHASAGTKSSSKKSQAAKKIVKKATKPATGSRSSFLKTLPPRSGRVLIKRPVDKPAPKADTQIMMGTPAPVPRLLLGQVHVPQKQSNNSPEVPSQGFLGSTVSKEDIQRAQELSKMPLELPKLPKASDAPKK